MSLRWDDLPVEPLGPGIATIGARYQEVVDMADGTRREFAGYVSGVARSQSGEWRLQHLHWSTPMDPAG